MNKKKKPEKQSNSKQERRKFNPLIILGSLMFIVIAIAVFFNMDEIYSYEKDKSGFPVTYTSNDVIDAQPMNGGVAVLTGKSLHHLDKSGKETFNLSYTLAEPALSVSDKYAVVFDRRSDNYIFTDSKGRSRQGKTQGNAYIYFAEVSEKGDLLIITNSTTSACHLYLYDKKGKETFAWACGDEYIVTADIDVSTGRILCGAIGSYAGEICTKAYLIDPKSAEIVINEYSVPGSSCTDVELYADKAVITCTDKLIVYDTNTAQDKGITAEYSSDALKFAKDSDGNTAIITDALTKESGEYCLSLYNSEGSLVYTAYFDSEAKDIYCSQGRVYLLSGQTVDRFAKDGSRDKSLSLEKKGIGVIVSGSSVYCYALGGVEKANES